MVHVGDQANGADVSAFVVETPPAGGYNGACYEVSAFGGGQESGRSKPYCLGASEVLQTITLKPTAQVVFDRKNQHPGPISNQVWDAVDYNGGDGMIGYTHYGAYADVTDEFWRMGVRFDTSQLANRRIASARLQLMVKDAFVMPPFDQLTGPVPPKGDPKTSCAASVGVGPTGWWTTRKFPDSYQALSPGPVQGPHVSIDVTPFVRGWAQGAPNNGLVLMGEEADIFANGMADCQSQYFPDATQLVVQFQ